MKKVSGKTHTQEQLNTWANQNNPNNKAYWANSNNHSNQLNPNRKTHLQMHNAERRYQKLGIVEWAPDFQLHSSTKLRTALIQNHHVDDLTSHSNNYKKTVILCLDYSYFSFLTYHTSSKYEKH